VAAQLASSHDVTQVAPPRGRCTTDGVVSAAGSGSGSASAESFLSYSALGPLPYLIKAIASKIRAAALCNAAQTREHTPQCLSRGLFPLRV
jgi:hypothetical protein